MSLGLIKCLPRRCCWTPAESRAETSWETCRPDWAGARRRAGRTRRRPTTERCCVQRRPSFAAVCLALQRPRRPRPSWATPGLPTEPHCYHSDHRTSGRTNTVKFKTSVFVITIITYKVQKKEKK